MRTCEDEPDAISMDSLVGGSIGVHGQCPDRNVKRGFVSFHWLSYSFSDEKVIKSEDRSGTSTGGNIVSYIFSRTDIRSTCLHLHLKFIRWASTRDPWTFRRAFLNGPFWKHYSELHVGTCRGAYDGNRAR